MATFTPRLNLRKPAGNDLVSVQTDISDNMDKLDQAGIQVWTGAALPTADNFEGRVVFATTLTNANFRNFLYVYKGGEWRLVSPVQFGARDNAGGNRTLSSGTITLATVTPGAPPCTCGISSSGVVPFYHISGSSIATSEILRDSTVVSAVAASPYSTAPYVPGPVMLNRGAQSVTSAQAITWVLRAVWNAGSTGIANISGNLAMFNVEYW